MRYREFMSLTDEEIIFIMKEIFPYTSRVDNIRRDEKWKRISCDIYIMEEEPDFADEIQLDESGISTHDFEITLDEEWKFKQFLLAKGCDERLKDNPYMADEEKQVIKNLVDEMSECGMFCGRYDAKNGSDKFMNGVNTVMEYLAYQVSEEYYNKFSDMFIKNMIESEKKVKD